MHLFIEKMGISGPNSSLWGKPKKTRTDLGDPVIRSQMEFDRKRIVRSKVVVNIFTVVFLWESEHPKDLSVKGKTLGTMAPKL